MPSNPLPDATEVMQLHVAHCASVLQKWTKMHQAGLASRSTHVMPITRSMAVALPPHLALQVCLHTLMRCHGIASAHDISLLVQQDARSATGNCSLHLAVGAAQQGMQPLQQGHLSQAAPQAALL